MHKRTWMAALLAVLLLTGCFRAPVQETTILTVPTTLPPVTEPPTEPPTTAPRETQPSETEPEYVLTARNAFVYDVAAEEFRFALGDMEERVYPASLTKLFTAWVALELLDPKAFVTCGEETAWIDPDSSRAWVSPGDTMQVERLIQGMMMQSGNDAAYMLAVAAGKAIAGGEELTAAEALQVFMDYMNRRAWEQGLENTFFVTPDGTTAEGHHTTPADLLEIAKLALEEPLIRKYAACQKEQVAFVSGEKCEWINTNWMMDPESQFYCADVIGLKTGSTKAAGNCLLALFDHNGREILICVLGCPTLSDRFKDALYLYDIYKE